MWAQVDEHNARGCDSGCHSCGVAAPLLMVRGDSENGV